MLRTLVFLTAACTCGAVEQGCGSSPRQSASSSAAAGSTNAPSNVESAGQPAAPPPMHMAATPVSTAAAGSGGSMGEGTAGMSAHVAGAGAGAGAAVNGAAGNGASAAPATGRERIPCDVDAVFKQQCRSCHGETLNLGAPMHLVTWSDLHAPAVSDSSKMVFELVAARVQDTMRPMPPKMNGKIAVADRMLLVSWSDQGAPALAGDTADCP